MKDFNFNFDINDPKVKLFCMILVICVVFILLAFFGDKSSGLKNSPFDKTPKPVEETKVDNFEDYLKVINSLSSKSHEYIYTIETDKDEEYFYLRASVDGKYTLYYKEYKDKEYVYLKKRNSLYVVGKNVLKKTNKQLSYEGYDITLFNTSNLYSLLKDVDEYEIVKEDGIIKVRTKVQLNDLIDIYNDETDEDVELTSEEEYLTIDLYMEDGKLVVNTDLKDYYKLVYKKDYSNIYYDLEFYNVGTTSLTGVEDSLTNI